jgi:hypothetical protein
MPSEIDPRTDESERLAELSRYFLARGARTTATRARALLSRLGSEDALRDDDKLDAAED